MQLLNICGDALWAEANKENISRFSEQLRETKEIVKEEAIFFDDDDYKDLRDLLEKFSEFGEGKIRLINIRSKEELEDYEYLERKIREQIVDNWDHKEKYENILENIRSSFRNRLSKIENQKAT